MNVLAGDKSIALPNRATGLRTARLSSIGWTATLTLALLMVIAVVAGYGLFGAIRDVSFERQVVAWSACGMLVMVAIVIHLMGRYLIGRSLHHVERQLRGLASGERLEQPLDASVPDDLAPVMDALGAYVDQVRTRVDRLNLQKKELDIQMRVADAERRHTEAVIFSISDAVLFVDPFGELVLANTAAEELFGFSLADARRRPIERLVDDPTLIRLIQQARADGPEGLRRQVEHAATRDGKLKTFKITLSTVLDAQEEPRGVVAVFHDITREREIAQMKTDFVSAVSHELRTPLAGIRAYVEMLIDGEAPDEDTRREFYDIIESQTDRLQRLVTKILDISRIESGVIDIHPERVQSNDVVREVVGMMTPHARKKGLTLDTQLCESLPELIADRDLLHQAIMNLVSNGIKYTEEGGRVIVRTNCEQDASRCVIEVSDNGIGIGTEDLPRIFDKFFRTPDSVGAAKEGTGLGLNLVKHIVETVHHGEISVISERGVGTTVTVRLHCHGA